MRKYRLLLAKSSHQALFWLALIALLVFVGSAFLHPVMVWTGPKSVKFRPPSMALNAAEIKPIGSVNVGISLVSQLVPTPQGVMLQLTSAEYQPRRYFNLTEGVEFEGMDERQAIWLAKHYTGEEHPVQDVAFVTAFSVEYPEVNRLLPVYRVEFATDDHLAAFIHTETLALAALDNDRKRLLKKGFQTFHTLSFLNDYPWLRMALMTLLLSTLIAMLITGVMLFFSIRRRRESAVSSLFWHRRLAIFMVLPFAGFLMSGTWHLFQSEYGTRPKGLRLGEPVPAESLGRFVEQFPEALAGERLNNLGLVVLNGTPYFRAGVIADSFTSQNQSMRETRFNGIPMEKGGRYFSVTGKHQPLTDEQVARILAANYLSLPVTEIQAVRKITRFGQGYDFRNKRLPVWQVDFATEQNDRLYIDPRTGIMVEHTQSAQQLEGLSFSLLHKWNFLKQPLGRFGRDVALMIALFFLLAVGIAGIRLRSLRRQKKQPLSAVRETG